MTEWVDRAYDILRENGLDTWRVEPSRGRRTIGLCDYTNKVIFISKHHMENENAEEVMDTIYHEVAHALNPLDGHGNKWRNSAISLGGTGEQYHSHGSGYPSKWRTKCVNGHSPKIYRWNKKSLYLCKCGSPLYITRTDGTKELVDPWYQRTFNRRAPSYGVPPVDQFGLPQL